MVNSKIIGCGHYLPQKILKNDDFKEFIDTSDEWIFTRTGIKQRHIASEARRLCSQTSGPQKDVDDDDERT